MDEIDLTDREFAVALSSVKNWAEKFIQFEGKPFKAYVYQDKFWQNKHRHRVVVKARQLGMSWACAIEALYTAMHEPHRKILLVSRTFEQALEVLSHAKDAYYSIPDKIRLINRILPDGTIPVIPKMECHVVEDKMTFENGSEIFSCPNNPETVRGYKAYRIYWDEAAKFPHEEEMQKAILPCITRGGKVVYNSTHQGTNSGFYENATKAKEGTSAFKFVYQEVPWWECPDLIYQEQVKMFIEEFGEHSFFIQEEYCCIASDESVAMFTHALLKASIDLFNKTEGDKTQLPITPAGTFPIYVGVDVGRTKDLTVFIAFEQMEGYARMIEMWELRGQPFEEQKAKIRAAIKRLKPTHVRIDAKGIGMEMAENFATEFGGGKDTPGLIEPMDFSPLVKDKLVYDTYIALSTGTVAMKENRQLYAQLHNLRREITEKTRVVRFTQSERSMHDDYLWSFCMAVSQITVGPPMSGVVFIGRDKMGVVGLDKTGSVFTKEILKPKPKEPVEMTKFQYDMGKFGHFGRGPAKEKCECGADLDLMNKATGEYICNGWHDEKTGVFVKCHNKHTNQNLCTIDCQPQFIKRKSFDNKKPEKGR